MIKYKINLNTGKIELTGDEAIKSAYSDGSALFWNNTTKRVEEDAAYYNYNKTTHSLGIGGAPAADARFHIKGTTTSHLGRTDTGFDFNLVVPPAAPVLALITAAGNIDVGNHYYRLTYVTALGETELNIGNPYLWGITTDAGHAQVLVTIPVSSDYRVTAVNIYRATTNQDYYVTVKKVGQVANGVTTFTDNVSDANRTGQDSFARGNTTNRFITVNSSAGMYIGGQNTFFGYRAGEGVLNGTSFGGENSIFGASSAIALSGTKNVAMGFAIGVGASDSSVLLGHNTGGIGQSFQYCIIMGRNAAFWNTVSYSSVILGGAKGTTYYSANYITSIGIDALNSIATGAGNLVALGTAAGANLTTSVGSVIIGAFVNAPSATTNGQLNIGNVLYGLGLYGTAASSSTPTTGGLIGVGIVPTGVARFELAAGTTSYVPLKLTSGALKTAAVAGGIEFLTDTFYGTITTGAARQTFAMLEATQSWTATQTFKDVKLGTAGNGLYVKEGTNATMGLATLVGGTVTVSTTKVTANSRIFLTVQGGTLTNVGDVYVSARTAATSFTITSLNVLDASDVGWIIIEPA